MIKAIFYLKDNKYYGFKVMGHAEYDEPGKDVICAGVSSLVINAVNSLEELTEDSVISEEDDMGVVRCKVMGDVSPESELILRSLRLGLCSIYEEYGDNYIGVYFREVNHD